MVVRSEEGLIGNLSLLVGARSSLLPSSLYSVPNCQSRIAGDLAPQSPSAGVPCRFHPRRTSHQHHIFDEKSILRYYVFVQTR